MTVNFLITLVLHPYLLKNKKQITNTHLILNYYRKTIIKGEVNSMVVNYKIKVTLKGFEKKIKRTFLVNDNIKIEDFVQQL